MGKRRRRERPEKPEAAAPPTGLAFPLRAVVALVAVGHGLLSYLLIPRPIFDKYPVAAAELAAGHGGLLPSDLSPLYLVLHLFLLPAPGGLVRGLQIFFGIAAGVAVARLAFREGGRRGALLAAGVYAVAAPLVAYESTLEPDALLASFSVLSLAATLGGSAAAGGAFAGLAVALRPTTLVFALLEWLWLASRRERRALGRWTVAAVLAAALPMAVVRLSLGGSTLAMMSFGQVLHQSNAPQGVGLGSQYLPLVKTLEAQVNRTGSGGADWAHEAYRRLAVADAGHALSPFAAELVWVRKVVAFVQWHPLAWLRLSLSKLRLVFSPFERHDIVPVFVQQSALPLLPSSVVYPLGALGLVFGFVRGRDRIFLVAALALAAPFLVFDVTARYRILWAPLAAVGAGGLADLVDALRAREQWRTAALAIVLAAVLVFPPATHRAGMRALDRGLVASRGAFRADEARRRGDAPTARLEMQRALAAQPVGLTALDLRGIDWDSPVFWNELRPLVEGHPAPRGPAAFDAGLVAARAGLRDEALRYFRVALEDGFYLDYTDGGDPAYEMGVLHLQNAQVAEARAAFARSLGRHPGVLTALVAGEIAARYAGDEGAVRAAAAEIGALHDPISASYERARLLRRLGRWQAALDALVPARDAFGESALVRWEEARAELGLGHRDAALAAYRTCLDQLPSYSFEDAVFDRDVFAAQAENPRDLVRLRFAADHAMRRGLFAEAVRLWRESLARAPELRQDPAVTGQLEYAQRALGAVDAR